MSRHDASIADLSSGSAMIEPENDRLEHLLGWWFKLTAPPRAAANASFVKREAERRARLVSTIGFIIIVAITVALPIVFFAPPMTVIGYFVSLASYSTSLLVNRTGHSMIASAIIVFCVEVALMSNIFLAYYPLNIIGLQTYDVLVVGVLFAVSLLPIWSVFFIAALNIAFILLSFFYMPHTANLDVSVDNNPVMTILYPIIVQIIVAGVTSLWVYTATRASEKARRAEVVARVEYAVSEQRAIAEQEKQELEAGIQQLVQTHIDANNGQMAGRIPYPSAQILWPLVGVLNALWTRQRHAQQLEMELQRLRQAIAHCDQAIQQANQHPGQPLPITQTGTELDSLLISLRQWQTSGGKR